jgi:hypothetical protein
MAADEKSEAWETLKMKHSQIRRVPLDSIYIDPRFQRALGEHRKDQIKDEFHPEGIGIVVVATIQGGDPAGSGKQYASIDGQTRLTALTQLRQEVADGRREVDGEVPDEITAEVYEDLTEAEAAELFRLRNFQTAVPVKERERIGLTAGDPAMQEVQRQVDMAGYKMFPEDGTPATMPYTDVGKRVVQWARKYGRPELLAEALTIQANAFGTEVGDVDKVVLQATADLLRKNPHLDEEQLTDLLRKRGTSRINGEADVIRMQLGMRKATAVEFYLVREYNNLKSVDKIRH